MIEEKPTSYKSHCLLYKSARTPQPQIPHIVQTFSTRRLESMCGQNLLMPGVFVSKIMTFDEVKSKYKPGVTVCRKCVEELE